MTKALCNTSSYHYDLPKELIAQYPLDNRSESRLLILNRRSGEIEHRIFHEIEHYFQAGDVLVLNKTRVIPARLKGRKTTGAEIELLLLNQQNETEWECLVKPGRRLKPGDRIFICDLLSAEIMAFGEEGSRIVRFEYEGDFFEILQNAGIMPLPPYITREATERDKETYQTVYAQVPGSVAAPTAGLHFTNQVLEKLRSNGIIITDVELNVGLGTFRPVKSEKIQDHRMHSEFCLISEETAMTINQAKTDNRRVICVGTTSTRTVESFAENGHVMSGAHYTDIFIYPEGRKLQIIDGLLTNFHLPGSTLLMLVSAFAGYGNIMKAYQEAISLKYRFFSYGDAMLII